MRLLSQGTVSILIGAHSIVHSYYVSKAWKILYGKKPSVKETICILLHDIGYWGTDYYANGSNAGHAELGAKIAGLLFGREYWLLVLGHSASACKKFGIEHSKLERPDEYSWIIQPMFWHKIQNVIEGYKSTPEEWVAAIKENFDSPNHLSGTEIANKLKCNK